jgi:hypothetical protein
VVPSGITYLLPNFPLSRFILLKLSSWSSPKLTPDARGPLILYVYCSPHVFCKTTIIPLIWSGKIVVK